MVEGEVPRRRGVDRRIVLVTAVLLCAATMALGVWALSPATSNDRMDDDGADDIGMDDESDDGGPSTTIDEQKGPFLEDMVLNVTDLPSSWGLASPYASFYQGYWPGNYSAMGGRGFNDTVTSDVELYLISQVFVYNTTEEAGMAIDEIKDLSIGLRENLTWDQVGEESVMGDYNYFGYLLGKVIIFQQDHYVCTMLYYAYTHETGDVTDTMILSMADLQLKKLL
jgi:hypothetical protein